MTQYTQFEEIRLTFRDGRLTGIVIDGERQPHACGILLHCKRDKAMLWIKNSLVAIKPKHGPDDAGRNIGDDI